MLHLTAELARQMGKKSAFCLSTGRRNSLAPLTMFSPCASCTPMSSKSFTGLRSHLRRKIPFHNTNPNGSAGNLMSNGCVSPQDAITDPDFFSFYQPCMTFEQFVREFAEWFSQKRPAAMMIGIRADESYNRFVAIASLNKQRFADDKPRPLPHQRS